MTVTSIKLDSQVRDRLNAEARRDGVPVGEVLVTMLVIAVPVTTVDRGWPSHVALSGPSGLRRPGWAMTEQPRTIDRGRLRGIAGSVDEDTVAAIDVWLRDFVALSRSTRGAAGCTSRGARQALPASGGRAEDSDDRLRERIA